MGEFFGALGSQIMETVLPVLATAIGGMVVAVLTKFLKKQDIELTEAQAERLKRIVTDAVQATEEAAHRRPLTSEAKREMTTDAVLAQAPETEARKLQTTIDSALTEVRATAPVHPAPKKKSAS